MKKWLLYVFLAAVGCMAVVSCTEDAVEYDPRPEYALMLKLKVYVPSDSRTRAAGAYVGDNREYPENLDDSTALQRYIEDISVLQFDAGGTLVHVVAPLVMKGKNGDTERWLEGNLSATAGDEAFVVVLANLRQQMDTLGFWGKFKGKTETEIYRELIYTYPADSVWDIGKRKLPMWGRTAVFSLKHNSVLSCNLYRGVAKLGVQLDSSCKDFALKEIYVYYINEKGYFTAPTEQPDEDVHVQYVRPDIPDCVQREDPLVYVVGQYAQDQVNVLENKKFLNRIYVPEADNTPQGKGQKAMKIVVGGIYSGLGGKPDELQYYRIDLADGKKGPGEEKRPFNVVRNHSYIFNIKEVNHPGTDTPEEALPSLTVSIEDWTDEFMHGIPDQYTLRTDKSVIRYEHCRDLDPQNLKIWTDLEGGWSIPDTSDWFEISQKFGPADQIAEITVTPKSENRSLTRIGHFYVVAGNIRKEIKVIMPHPEIANCYIVDGGEHELIVTIKGNGRDGVFAEDGVSLIPGKPEPTDDDIRAFVGMRPKKLGVIWETHAGLVTLIDWIGNPYVNVSGQMTYVDLPADQNSIRYNVNLDGASIGGVSGGNALIGAFDENNKIIWSWHIWVSPDLIDPATRTVRDKFVEKWTINDYDVLDRNLGALSNRPMEPGGSSVASMGLLYQWGRKDPFIGANYSARIDYSPATKGLLPVVHYYKEWGIKPVMFDDSAISATIEDPTLLVHESGRQRGMSSIPGYGEYLWGVKDGLNPEVKNLGVKTIYDPSPAGFRVPPVDAFVFDLYKDYDYRRGKEIDSIDINLGESAYTKEYHAPVYWKHVGGETKLALDGKVRIEPPASGTRTYVIYHANKINIPKKLLISSETKNWRWNLVYVPHCVEGMTADRYQWSNEPNYDPFFLTRSIVAGADPLQYLYTGPYVSDARYYGFYMNHENLKHEPVLDSDTETHQGHPDHYYYRLKAEEEHCTSWFPLTAVYDPNKGFSLDRIKIQKGESVTVNSFLWMNSTVENRQQKIVPAAMFLHGTEDHGTGYNANGRHIHNLRAVDVRAEPQYAGAVRSIRDRKKTVWEQNWLADTADIAAKAGATTEITIISVNNDWKLVRPGAPWLKVMPDHGSRDKGKGSAIVLTMLDPPASVGDKTSLVFQIEGESEEREVTVLVIKGDQ